MFKIQNMTSPVLMGWRSRGCGNILVLELLQYHCCCYFINFVIAVGIRKGHDALLLSQMKEGSL